MSANSQLSKSDVLHAFSAESNPNADTLASYLKRFPQFREALVDLSIELFTVPRFDAVPVERAQSNNAEQAWSKFQSLLNPSDPASVAFNTVENPLSKLSDQRFRELADELNINRLLLSRLRDCYIQVPSIPQRFLTLLAEPLAVTVEGLRQALSAPPSAASGIRYKASGKPNPGEKITFDVALTTSGLTEVQRTTLEAMQD